MNEFNIGDQIIEICKRNADHMCKKCKRYIIVEITESSKTSVYRVDGKIIENKLVCLSMFAKTFAVIKPGCLIDSEYFESYIV